MEQLIQETLDSCQEYIPKLIKAVSATAYKIQSGNEADGVLIMSSIFEGLQWVIDAVQGLKNNGHLLEIDISNITDHLKELEEALKIRDYVLVADLFEYEIGPALQTWLGNIQAYLK